MSINILAGISLASAAAWPDQSGVKSVLPFCSAAARSGGSSPMGSGKSGAASDQGPISAVRRLTRTLAGRPEYTFVTMVWFTRAFRRASR
jgi:hypothetical protein